MKITIDTAQSPIALMNELTQVVRFALGPNHFIETSEGEPAFTPKELVDPNVNIVPLATASVVPSASGTSTPTTSGAVATAPASGAVELDAEGHPYDVRIHSAGKSKIANGTWKLKKGVDKALVTQINAQNKALVGATLPTAAPALSLVASTPAPTDLPALAAMPDLPALPPVAQVPPPDVEIDVTDYTSLMAWISQKLAVKPNTTKTRLDEALVHYRLVDVNGNPDSTAIQHRPEVIPTMFPWLKATIDLGQG